MASFKLHDTASAIDYLITATETSIGRSPESDIRLLSSSVSRNHGVLKIKDDILNFEDFGSSNGTYINTIKVVGETALKNGDALQVGDFELKVLLDTDDDTTTFNGDDDATQIGAYSPPEVAHASPPTAPAKTTVETNIPAMWSENAGLEQASGTVFFSEDAGSEASTSYRDGNLNIAPIGDTPRLIGLNLSIQGVIYPLDTGVTSVWKIGRDQQHVDLWVAESSVSGLHAQLINDGQRWKVVNWMSTNGTFVNELKGLSTYLKNGDIIRMGIAEFAFELPTAPQGSVSKVTAESPKKKGFFARLFGK
ncbi:FHA domain-containing protein [Zhongshania sp.]|jgi:pSer/pThr/pTyr-binding forkhead associated (FHA) protein|uniref:FHA domain-containing protein n=1 Tax=Zhongshania sp. TaxID=1971902 RepID=UPI0039E5FE44